MPAHHISGKCLQIEFLSITLGGLATVTVWMPVPRLCHELKLEGFEKLEIPRYQHQTEGTPVADISCYLIT